jgi:two-component system sensor histidine kinase KdpD
VALVLVVLWPFNDRIDPSVPALLLLVPIVIASVIGGWRAAVPLAVLAALGYSFGYLPPVGDIRPNVGRDVVTLATFVVVGLAVGVLAQRGRDDQIDAGTLLDERRAQLLRTVGHDLRNPLHTIQAVTTGLMSSAPDDRARASLAAVAAESERLDRIVANMLSASRIQAGALLPEVAPEHLAALVDATVTRLGGAITQTVSVELPGDVPDVVVDAVQFDQVLTNLLENASRHGQLHGTIQIAARRVGARVELSVTDDGPGFGLAELAGPEAFRPGPGSASTGLGLTVCHGIIAAHGGTLTLGNGVAGGAVVTVSLPAAG